MFYVKVNLFISFYLFDHSVIYLFMFIYLFVNLFGHLLNYTIT
jgi:hypothetical protein